jgi:hypothetical protein
MKKLWMLLIALALLVTAVPMFASDVTFSGRMIWATAWDADLGADSMLVRFRPKLTAKIDDFTTLVAEFRMENYAVLKTDLSGDIWSGLRVKDAYMTTDVTGALGLDLPVTISTKIGQFEPGFTDWAYASESGWENYYEWPNKLADVGPFDAQATGQVDIGFGPAVLHIYSDFLGFMMFGLSGGFGPVSGWLTYQSPKSGPGDGIIGIEAKYAGEFGDFKLGVPVFFRYEMADTAVEEYTYGVGASADYKMFHLGAGVEGDSVDALDNVVVDVSVAPLEPLKIQANAYLDLGAVTDNALVGINLEASYKLGAATYMLGYVIKGEDELAIPMNGDTFGLATGLWFAVDVSF